MRLAATAVFVVALPLLAACSNDQAPKPAAETPAPRPAVTAPATPGPATPAPTTAKLPSGAEPLIGTWAAALSDCGNAGAVTTITATSYASPAGRCEMNLKPSNDGFVTACGNAQMTLTPVFAPSGEGVNVVVGDGKRQTVLRCTR